MCFGEFLGTQYTDVTFDSVVLANNVYNSFGLDDKEECIRSK